MSTLTNTTSSRHHRKQRFPRLDRRKLFHDVYRSPSPSDLESDPLSVDRDFGDDVDDTEFYCKRPRLSVQVAPSGRPSNQPTTSPSIKRHHQQQQQPQPDTASCRLDKRARDEHNEQERSRRRELAVIYELIRCSFSEDDLRHLGQCSGPKSIEKLSYPQVLQIAYQLLMEEQHNLIMFEKSLQAIKLVEKEYLHVGLPVPQRPFCPAIPDSHRKVIQVVDSLLKQDKSARTPDGVYEVTPAQRAAMGDHQLSSIFPHPASSTDQETMPVGQNRAHPHTGFGTGVASLAAGRPRPQLSKPGNLLITNGAPSSIAARPPNSSSSSSSSRATVHRNSAFKMSTSHSDSSSAAGSPRTASTGLVDSTDGSAQQLMVFDWLGLKEAASASSSSCLPSNNNNSCGVIVSSAADDDVSAEYDDLSRPPQQQQRWCQPTRFSPPTTDRRLIRTSNGGQGSSSTSTTITWRLRHQEPSEEEDGLFLDLMPSNGQRSLVGRSPYSNVKA